jgi:hypothetical protein
VILDAKGQIEGELTSPESGPREGIPALAISVDGGTLVAATDSYRRTDPNSPRSEEEQEIQLLSWNLKSRQPGLNLKASMKELFPGAKNIQRTGVLPTACAVHPNGRWVAIASFVAERDDDKSESKQFSGLLLVWDEARHEIFRRVTSEPLRAVAWDAQGRIVAAGGIDSSGVVYAFDIPDTVRGSGNPTGGYTLRGHSRFIMGLAFHPDGRLATAGADRVVKLWDTATGREVLTLDGFAREVTHVAFATDGGNLAAATGLDFIRMMERRSGKQSEWPPAEVRIFRGRSSR